MAKTELKISPQTRSRLLFERELQIDLANKNIVSQREILDGLVLQQSKLEKQRDALLKSSVLCIFMLIFIQNGGDIKLPGFDIQISEIPAIEIFLVLVGAFSIFMMNLSFISVNAYSGLIDQYSKLYSGPVDQEIFSASLSPDWLVLKVLRCNFNFFHSVYIQPGKVGRFHLIASELIIQSIFLVFVSLIYLYLLYYSVFQIENTITGLVVKSVSVVVIFSSVYLQWVSEAEFKHFVEENSDDVDTQNRDTEKAQR